MKKKMGRPPVDGIVRETKLFVKVSEDEAKEIEELANYLEIPKSVLLRNLALSSLEDAQILKKVGLLQIAKGIRKTSEALKEFKNLKDKEALERIKAIRF